MTSIALPLDVAINKPFKEYMKQKYEDYCIFTNEDNRKVRPNTIILNWISEK